jgi:hypothetical protein
MIVAFKEIKFIKKKVVRISCTIQTNVALVHTYTSLSHRLEIPPTAEGEGFAVVAVVVVITMVVVVSSN